ncbi:MAG: S-layer homology domain-containing protein [Clostridia bacterium]|nr:S-layer homology domain-containing protein [Clostridia bacterium]
MNKKLLSFLTALVLILSSVHMWALATDETVQTGFHFSELGSEYDLLKALGIITDPNGDKLGAEVTRGEFASLAVRSFNLKNLSGASLKFIDVPANHPYYNEIGALVQMGILKGTSDTTFAPDEKITVAQVACAALRMINMGWATENASMQQIVSTAAAKGLLDGLGGGDYYKPAYRADVYIILFNTIQTSMYVNTSYGEEPDYTLQKDTTILSEYWKLKKAQGLVTADYYTAIDGNRTDKEDKIIVGGVEFTTDTDTTVNKVGRQVEIFYREDGKDKTIVFASSPDSKVVVLDAKDITFDYLGGKYTIDSGNKEIDFKIGDSYYLSYNGDPIIGSNRELMSPRFGSVTLIDNGTGIYNVVMVEEYYTLIVDYYDSYTTKIFDIKDSARNIVLDDYQNVQINVEPEKLSKNSVLNIYKTPSKEFLKIEVSDAVYAGKVVEMSVNSGIITVSTQDKDIEISGDTRFDTSILEPGTFYTFYFDSLGNAVYATAGTSRFGVILTYSQSGKIGARDSYILFKDGTKGIYELASNIKVRTENGTSTISSKDIESAVARHTMALFEVNNKGQIKEITLPMVLDTLEEYNNPPTYPFYKVDYFLKEWPLDIDGSTQYRREITGFGNWLILDKATVMQVPVSPGNSYTDENTTAYGIAKFQDDYDIVVNKNPTSVKADGEIEIFQFPTDGLTPSILLIHGGPSNDDIPLSTDSLPHIITKITKGYDEITGQEATKLELMNSSGKTVSAFVKEERIISRDYLSTVKFRGSLPQIATDKNTLAVGDVIQIAQRTGDGKIGKIALIYDKENDLLAYPLTGYDTIYRMVSGEVISSTDTFMAFTNSQGRIERTTIGSASVIVINKLPNGKQEFTFGSRADIMPGSKIAMYCRYLNNRLIFVYKD